MVDFYFALRQQARVKESCPAIGIAITTFRSAEVISACLDSIFASCGATLRVVVVDNASDDDTRDVIRAWAAAKKPAIRFAEAAVGAINRAAADLTLLTSPVNGGFARACNQGMEVLLEDPAMELIWLLNPDCEVMPDTAAQFIAAGRDGGFSLMGGRTIYHGRSDLVQTDGGRVSLRTGVVRSVNQGRATFEVAMPDAGRVDFITGACLVASRAFILQAGLMPEDYFLYYEEVDWAMRRGTLPLRQVPTAIVRHHGGTAIGSGSIGRRASAFSNYFNFRNRMRFIRRYAPNNFGIALAYALAKAAQLVFQGGFSEAHALVAGLLELPPPASVRDRVAQEARGLAFAPFQSYSKSSRSAENGEKILGH